MRALACGPSKRPRKRQRQQLDIPDLVETVLLERFADVQGGSSVAGGGAMVARDVYSLCAGKCTLSLLRLQQPPKGWAARSAHMMTMKTPQQLLLLVGEFLRVKEGTCARLYSSCLHKSTMRGALLAQEEHDGISAVQQLQVLSDDVDGIHDDEQQAVDEADDEDEE